MPLRARPVPPLARRSLAPLPLALTGSLAVLVLVGCSPTPGAGPATETASASASPSAVPTASTPASAPATDAAAGDDPAEASESNCLVGDWVLTEDQMQLYYDQVTADLAEFAVAYEATGSSALAFRDDGTYAYAPDLAFSVDIAGLPAEATLGGTLSGQYAVDGDTLTTSNDSNELSMDVTVEGVAMDGTAVTEQILASPIISAPYDCSGDTPVIHFSTGASSVPLTLARG
jgi:hypothetical protein